MACGAGLYFPATFATVVVIAVLELIRLLEYRANLKLYSVTYEARGSDAEQIGLEILKVMDRENRRVDELQNQPVGPLQRLSLSVTANRRIHHRLLAELNACPAVVEVRAYRDPEDE